MKQLSLDLFGQKSEPVLQLPNECSTCAAALGFYEIGGKKKVKCQQVGLREYRVGCGGWMDPDPAKRFWWPDLTGIELPDLDKDRWRRNASEHNENEEG